MRNRSFLALSLTVLVIGIATPAAGYTETFGAPGKSGQSGRDGRDGRDGDRRAIRITGTPQTVNLIGGNGADGEAGRDGEDAYFCRQPEYSDHNLRGADGGNGGAGGRGGKGGKGGTVSLFYQDIAQLSTFQLVNRGGRGGRGARGGRGGDGCEPTDRQWTVRICRWELQSRAKHDPQAPWRTERHKRQRCRDEYGRNRPRRRRNSSTKEYRWKFDGVVDRDRYYADPGADGRDGPNGHDGRDGEYGRVFLVRGNRIPQERLSYSAPIADIGERPIAFLKNNWLNKAGLSQLLAPGSDVPDRYRQLQTVRNQLQVKWQAPQSIAALGNPKIQAEIDRSGNLKINLPGHLEYQQRERNGITEVTIVRGIAPERLQKVEFRGFEQFRDARNFALIDPEKLLPALRGLIIRVKVSDGAQTVKQVYRSSPNQPASTGLEILGNIYKIRLGESFVPLLAPGKKLDYTIEVDQIARSGAVYTSRMEMQQVVDQVTFSQVQYTRLPQPTE